MSPSAAHAGPSLLSWLTVCWTPGSCLHNQLKQPLWSSLNLLGLGKILHWAWVPLCTHYMAKPRETTSDFFTLSFQCLLAWNLKHTAESCSSHVSTLKLKATHGQTVWGSWQAPWRYSYIVYWAWLTYLQILVFAWGKYRLKWLHIFYLLTQIHSCETSFCNKLYNCLSSLPSMCFLQWLSKTRVSSSSSCIPHCLSHLFDDLFSFPTLHLCQSSGDFHYSPYAENSWVCFFNSGHRPLSWTARPCAGGMLNTSLKHHTAGLLISDCNSSHPQVGCPFGRHPFSPW